MKDIAIGQDTTRSEGITYYHRFNTARLGDTVIDELIGVCERRTTDGKLICEEIRSLKEWILQNRGFRDLYPVNVLYQRIREILLDGVIYDNERAQLFSVLSEFTGFAPGLGREDLSSSMPLDIPAPEVIIPNHNFCFAGVFAFGTHERCEAETTIRKGRVLKEVSFQTDFLIIGELSSMNWIHSPYVRKIAKAIEVRELIKGLWIVSEENWIQGLERTAP